MAEFRLRAGLGALLCGILITVGGCADRHPTGGAPAGDGTRFEPLAVERTSAAPTTGLINASAIRTEKVIGPEGGVVDIPGGHSVTFPAGALSSPTRIRARADAQFVAVDLEPHGIRFPAGHEPVLTLSYANAAPFSFRLLTIIYTDEAGRFLENMGGATNSQTRSVSAVLPHFSRYALVGAN